MVQAGEGAEARKEMMVCWMITVEVEPETKRWHFQVGSAELANGLDSRTERRVWRKKIRSDFSSLA